MLVVLLGDNAEIYQDGEMTNKGKGAQCAEAGIDFDRLNHNAGDFGANTPQDPRRNKDSLQRRVITSYREFQPESHINVPMLEYRRQMCLHWECLTPIFANTFRGWAEMYFLRGYLRQKAQEEIGSWSPSDAIYAVDDSTTATGAIDDATAVSASNHLRQLHHQFSRDSFLQNAHFL
jgi:hypothetical protein